MADPRLNSIHLDPPRREQYRRAREVLLNARGTHTLVAEHNLGRESNESHTIIQFPNREPSGLACWLTDGTSIFPLKVGLNTVGRSPDNDVVLADGYTSRRHCAILVHKTRGVEVYDTASKNGTYVNGVRLEYPVRLRSGDEIRVCDHQLRFVSKDELPAPSPTATLGE